MPNFSERLRTERERLELSQQGLAEKCGVTARSQRNYESGERNPDSVYLAAIAAAGADVLYILTGQRTEGTASDPAEQVLLDSYRRCKPDAKANLIQMAALLSAGFSTGAEETRPRKAASSATTVIATGIGGQAAGRDIRNNETSSKREK